MYFDTEDLRLARSGITLRRRNCGSDDGWHLEASAASDRRDEVRLPQETSVLHPPPGRTDPAPHRGAPLVPVVELDIARREWTLADTDGHPLAMVTDDPVIAQTLAAPTSVTRWGRSRSNLPSTAPPRCSTASSRRCSMPASTAPRVVEARPGTRGPVVGAPPRPVADKGRDCAGDVVLAYLWDQADAIRATDPPGRQNAPIPCTPCGWRVAGCGAPCSRPLVLDRERTDALVDELRWLAAGSPGPATSRSRNSASARPSARWRASPPWVRLSQTPPFFARRRADASDPREALDSNRYLVLLDAIDALLPEPPH